MEVFRRTDVDKHIMTKLQKITFILIILLFASCKKNENDIEEELGMVAEKSINKIENYNSQDDNFIKNKTRNF